MNRLHPRIRVVWAVQAAVSAAVVALVVLAVDRLAVSLPAWGPPVAFAVVLVGGVGLAVVRYRVWRYEVRDDALYLERGVFTRVRTVVPFVRIQHVDSSRGPAERLVGLASTVVYTAGSRGADVTVPGLTPDGADDLRERLKGLAIRAEGDDAV
ncbi:MAG: PH domain-containing protein [Haloplanus sp.]